MRVFVDTNVMIDFVCKREPFFDTANVLFDLAYRGNIDMSISTLSFVNTYYIGLKYKCNHVGLQDTLKHIQSFVNVAAIDNDMLTKALNQGIKDVEDAIQYHSAKSVNAECVVTRNKKDFTFSSIPVYTPEELLDILL